MPPMQIDEKCALRNRASLLYANVEWKSRMSFSALKLIKSDRCGSLSENTLLHLVRIAVDGPPLALWDASDAVQPWWISKQHRPVQHTRLTPRPGSFSGENDSTEQYTLNQEDWDACIQ